MICEIGDFRYAHAASSGGNVYLEEGKVARSRRPLPCVDVVGHLVRTNRRLSHSSDPHAGRLSCDKKEC